ncbi:MAG: SCO family protein [Alphaproteobacteria bacterium]|nr:SCO family protein [Alphaproteobacteria bacterium]
MTAQFKKRLFRTFFLSLAALIAGAGIAFYQISADRDARQEGREPEVMKVAGADIGGAFTLVDSSGRSVTDKEFEGQFLLIYFGFTYCPAICPTELRKISEVVSLLEADNPEAAKRLQPLFITVDPQRDTPEVVGAYISLFHPRLVGLSGSAAQIEQVKKDYRIYAVKVQEEGMSDYTFDHSSFIYLIDPARKLAGIYRIEDAPAVIYKDVRRHMGL